MKGFSYGNIKKDFLEKIDQNKAQLSLLTKGDGTEIMIQDIDEGEYFGINPGESELMEFFLVLEGKLIYVKDDRNIEFKQEDFFYINNLKETINFKTVTPVKLLYVSTQPIFENISSDINELYEIAKRVEEKDKYTDNHLDRVKNYAAAIGEKLGISKTKFEDLCFAALFHDIGKIHIPIEILNKETKLSDEEMAIIKKHPIKGRELVENTSFENIGDIIEQHHERVDGSGYPYGLKGDQILFEAKIIGVADSFDAMTTDRPYRKGMNPELAFQELRDINRKQFNQEIKEILDVFEEILKEREII